MMNKLLVVVCASLRRGLKSWIAHTALALAATLPSLPALAERHGEDRHWHGEEDHHWHGEEDHHWHGDIARFHEHDWDLWRGGRWAHEVHDGRLGWWWVAGDSWYFYPAPVYPYPDPYEPPVTVAVAPPAAAPAAPVPNSWYYCEGAKGYYPYVPTCPGGWKRLPANPASPANSAPPPQ
jgi:hypothetical protein